MELIDAQKAKQTLVDLPPELDAITVFVGVCSGKQMLFRLLSKMDVENSVDNVEKG